MKIFPRLAFLQFALLSASQISAAPIIEATAGDYKEEQIITITGANFGNADAVPLVWDSVDNQIESGSSVNSLKVPYGDSHTWGDNTHDDAWGNDVIFSTNNPKPGRSTSYSGYKRSDLGWPTAVNDKGLKNIYVSWWLWLSEDPKANGGSNKFIRIWDDPNGKHTRISWTSMHLDASNAEISWPETRGNAGEWNKFEIWVSGDDKTIKAWVNNTLIHDINDFAKKDFDKGLNVYLLGWDPSESSKYPDFKFNMSDIYISSTVARVEISNKPNWSDTSAIKETQPIQLWTDKEIQFRFNSGSFDDLAGKYLYIVDSNGDVNSTGHLICTKCPAPPILEIE